MGPIEKQLRDARRLLAKKGGWCQKVFARTANGQETMAISSRAASFCVVGSLMRTRLPLTYTSDSKELLEKIVRAPLIKWNDSPTRKKSEVLVAFTKAAALAMNWNDKELPALTVTGLIELLQRCPPDSVVSIDGCDCANEAAGVRIDEFGEVNICRQDQVQALFEDNRTQPC